MSNEPDILIESKLSKKTRFGIIKMKQVATDFYRKT